MSYLQSYARKIYARFGIALLSYLAFLGMHLNLLLVSKDPSQAYYSLIPLVLAFVMMPRNFTPKAIAYDMLPEEGKTLHLRLQTLGRSAIYVRGMFSALALFVLLLLPRLL